MQRGRPWLRLKVAASLDGRTALTNGTSQWITGEAARTDGHAFRRRAWAVLTGIGTVLEDDPRLDVRLVPTARQPLRVVVDSRLRRPPTARIARSRPARCCIYAAGADAAKPARAAKRAASRSRCCPAGGKVDLAAMLADLARRGINELHVEAGHKLNGSLLREGLVDELLVYLAPKLLGSGRDMAAFGPLERPGRRAANSASSQVDAGRRRPAHLARLRSGRARLATLAVRRRPGGDNRRMFTGIITGVGRIVEAAALGAGAGTASALAIEAPRRLPRRRAARRQHRAERRLHDRRPRSTRQRAASTSTSRPRACDKTAGLDAAGAGQPGEGAARRTTGWAATSWPAMSTASATSAASRRSASWELRVARAARHWRASWPTRARSPSTASA